MLKTNPYFVKDYKRYANKYTLTQLEETLKILGDYDLKSKGLGNKSLNASELLTEMTYTIFSL
jgi:DNA polymerase-3 subunit delta